MGKNKKKSKPSQGDRGGVQKGGQKKHGKDRHRDRKDGNTDENNSSGSKTGSQKNPTSLKHLSSTDLAKDNKKLLRGTGEAEGVSLSKGLMGLKFMSRSSGSKAEAASSSKSNNASTPNASSSNATADAEKDNADENDSDSESDFDKREERKKKEAQEITAMSLKEQKREERKSRMLQARKRLAVLRNRVDTGTSIIPKFRPSVPSREGETKTGQNGVLKKEEAAAGKFIGRRSYNGFNPFIETVVGERRRRIGEIQEELQSREEAQMLQRFRGNKI